VARSIPPTRVDAVRNRQLLLDAAAEAFAERGSEVSIGEIAQRAGIGKGTVFRHFASKEELLAAIMLRLLGELTDTGNRLLEAGDPGAALREFMTTGVGALVKDRAFCEVIGHPSLQHSGVREGIDRLCGIAEVLAARARDRGAVRPDVTGVDIVLLIAGVRQTAAPLLTAEPEVWRRYLELTFDGLRTATPHGLPYPPPQRPRFTEGDGGSGGPH
jgi:AcrR family transcriptional regulator